MLDFLILDLFIGNFFFKILVIFGDGIMIWEFLGSDVMLVVVGVSF